MSEAWMPEPLDGAGLLDDVESFVSRFVAYPSEAARVAHVLWIAHTWLMDCWDSTPRIAFLSPEPGSGKSRALEVTEPLVPRPVHAVNTSPAYLFRKVSDEDGAPTILYDEIDTVFGPRAKDNEDIRGMLNAGHRRGATAGRCVVKGKRVETEELPAYCAVALAGLDDLPDTIMTRSVVVRMRRRAPDEKVEPWRMRVNGPDGELLGARLADWAGSVRDRAANAWPVMPEGIEDRPADVWEALLAVADLAGGDWPDRARCNAVTLVTQASGHGRASLGITLLRDLRTVFAEAGAERLSSDAILDALHLIEESPWADLRGKPLDARGLRRRLAKYDTEDVVLKPRPLRIAGDVVKGYDAGDFHEVWSRYLPALPRNSVTAPDTEALPISDSETPSGAPSPPQETVTSVTPVTSQVRGTSGVTDDVPVTDSPVVGRNRVTDVTEARGGTGGASYDIGSPAPTHCQVCGNPLLLREPGRTTCERCDRQVTR